MAHHWRVASWGSASRPPRWRGASSTSTTRCPSSTRSAALGRRRGRMTDRREIKIEVPALARVEGEGALDLHIRDGVIQSLQLRIYEPPRYFEQLLLGRNCTEVPDLVARICGICPVAYQMSAVQALEGICGFTPPPWLLALRHEKKSNKRKQKHRQHNHKQTQPDQQGYNSITAMAAEYSHEVR